MKKFGQNQKTQKLLVGRKRKTTLHVNFSTKTKEFFNKFKTSEGQQVFQSYPDALLTSSTGRGLVFWTFKFQHFFLFQTLIKSNGCCHLVYPRKHNKKKESLLNLLMLGKEKSVET